jgi:hypothetical protein
VSSLFFYPNAYTHPQAQELASSIDMEPIHRAAYDGNLARINSLVAEDGRRLNAQIQGDMWVDGWPVEGCTPLHLAALKEHDAVVARLLGLRADVGLRDDVHGLTAAHCACYRNRASSLGLLLDAGSSINARSSCGQTPLIVAAHNGATDCVKLLLARGGDALELDAVSNAGNAAMLLAAQWGHAKTVQLLLQAGANPTIRNNSGNTPLYYAQLLVHQSCIVLLEPAMAEPQRPRSLLKARALLDAAHAIPKARTDAADKGQPPAVQQEEALATAPAYLKGRVAEGRDLPAVQVVVNEQEEGEDEELVACLKYALGLEGGGGWHEGEGPAPQQGMLKEVFVELCELLVPKWDRANV